MDDDRRLRRQRNVEIFLDTMIECSRDPYLAESIMETNRNKKLILEGDVLSAGMPPERAGQAQVIVSGRRSFEAARRYAGKKVCVLNFASATGPGGGVRHGSSAQEESLCRCSTLYPSLASQDMWDAFYAPHREAGSRLYNDDIIYCPGVVVFKSDDSHPQMLPRGEWYKVDVLTCAAPNLRHFDECDPDEARGLMNGGLEKLLEKRIRRIFEAALCQGAEVLVLGAFGCGAFRNPPDLVASVFRRVVEGYGGHFETIEFAVFHMGSETANYNAFRGAFADMAQIPA